MEALEAGMHSPPGYGPGSLPHRYRLPLKAADYRMDTVMSFKIRVAGLKLLFEHCLDPKLALPVDILFLNLCWLAAISHPIYPHHSDFRPAVVIPCTPTI